MTSKIWERFQINFNWAAFDPETQRAFVSERGPVMIGLPPEILDLKKLDEDSKRMDRAEELATAGWPIDFDLDVRQWGPRVTMGHRQDYGWTWTRARRMPPSPIAPGLGAPGAEAYDPFALPLGAILVPPAALWRP